MYKIAEELKALTHYTSLYAETVNSFDFKIIVDQTIDTSSYLIPPMLIQPLIENAIKHGIGSNGNENLVELEISHHGQDFLCCQVRDNGKGFKEADLLKSKSIALNIVQERLQNYKKPKDSAPFDIISGNGTQSTKVTIIIPFVLD